ncbi:MAG: hypothetical protein ACKO96_14015, partial [Flammeovirgaceae bacterium]
LDFGSRDPDAMLKAAIDEKNRIIYLDEVMFKSNQSSAGLIRAVESRIERPNDVIVGDSEDRRMRRDLHDAGFNIKRAYKFKGSVLHTIKTLQSYKLVVTEKSLNLHKALNNYIWSDKVAEVPENKFKHLPDAAGYIVMYLLYGEHNEIEWNDDY